MNLKAWVISIGLALTLGLASCSDNDDDDQPAKPLFDPKRGDAVAHEALPSTSDLPGRGWQVIAEDEFDDDDDAVQEAFEAEPTCKHLANLAALGSLFGEEEERAGRAQREFERPIGQAPLPASLEVEIEIQDTVADVERGWDLAKNLLTSDATKRCFEKMVPAMVAREDPSGQLQIDLKSVSPSAGAPHDGAALAFEMTVRIAGAGALEANMELYFWPYSNAEVTLVLVGPRGGMEKDFVRDVVTAVNEGVEEAGD